MRRAAAVFFLCALAACAASGRPRDEQPRPYRAAALAAARWIGSEPASSRTDLYSGTPGAALLLAALGQAVPFLDATSAPSPADPSEAFGLYTGLAGQAFVSLAVGRRTKDERCLERARALTRELEDAAQPTEHGLRWGPSNDIISGSAGIGLYLIEAARELEDPRALASARQAGLELLSVAELQPVGRSWRMDPSFERRMPNFSHGSAGIAYFLATLYQATGERSFLDAAIDGARYLQSIADRGDDGRGCRIRHHDPGGETLFYLGWCHGPVGTARLFYRLHEITRDPEWMEWVERCAHSVMASGLPEVRSDGFWNNDSMCCGTAGVLDFLCALYRVTGEQAYLDLAQRCGRSLLARATPAGDGLKWTQAEHRVEPDLLLAQTGYAQGAAGIGLALLRLELVQGGSDTPLRLPDSPW